MHSIVHRIPLLVLITLAVAVPSGALASVDAHGSYVIAPELRAPVYDVPFASHADYDTVLPTLRDLLGADPPQPLSVPRSGDEILAAFQALAAASPRVHVEFYGESHEGRPLFFALVGAPERMNDIDVLRAQRKRLADPRGESDGFAAEFPALIWIGAAVHGNEPSGADAALALLHHLATDRSERTLAVLDEALVIIDPLQNPDGRARFLARMTQWESLVPDFDRQSAAHRDGWPSGRVNHYLLDLNRDWFALSQPETRGRVRVLNDWQPQVSFDLHEMGSFDSYLFSPPREPFNPQLPATTAKWWGRISRDMAGAFGREGWSCYTRDWHEEFNPNRGAGWPLHLGTVSFLGEQASTDGITILKPDGSLFTYRQAVHQQFTAALSMIESASRSRAELVADYAAVRRAGGGKGCFIIDRTFRSDRADHFARTLALQGIELGIASASFRQRDALDYYGEARGGEVFPAGSYIINLAQPQGRLARAILAFDPEIGDEFLTRERHSLERGEGSLLYESPAWSLAMAQGVKIYESAKGPFADIGAWRDPLMGPKLDTLSGAAKSPYGYLLAADEPRAELALTRLHGEGVQLWAAGQAFSKDGRDYPAGSVIVKRRGNAEDLELILERVAAATGVRFDGIAHALVEQGQDLGSRGYRLLSRPRVALLIGPPFFQTTCGALWHYCDLELGLPCSRLKPSALASANLDLYNVIILPDAGPGKGADLAARIGEEGIAQLLSWLRRGGTLIALGESCWFVAGGETPLSSLRLRRDVLDELDVYLNEARRDESLRDLSVDEIALRNGQAEAIRGLHAPPAASATLTVDEDAFLRRFSPRGAILRVDLDASHWLAAGVGERVPVLLRSDLALMSRQPIQTVGRFSDSTKLRLSGLLWPEASARLARSSYLTREAVGKGQIISFLGNPTYRAYFSGSARLIANAILLGPGLGADAGMSK